MAGKVAQNGGISSLYALGVVAGVIFLAIKMATTEPKAKRPKAKIEDRPAKAEARLNKVKRLVAAKEK